MQAPVPSQHPHRPRRPGQRGLARRAVLRGATASGLATVLAALAALPPSAPAAAATPGASTPAATSQAPSRPADLRPLAATCANCHGTDGRPADPTMPPLAGLPQDLIQAQMRAFRSGERPATVMHQISRGYTDAQVEALARYFAGLPR